MSRHIRFHDRKGATAVEFALVAPVFFLLVMGLIEFGRTMMVKQSLTNAAREGCRVAGLATTTDAADAEAAVRDYLQSVVPNAHDPAKIRVTRPATLAGASSGTELSISVEADYGDVSWTPFSYVGINPTIRAEVTTQRE